METVTKRLHISGLTPQISSVDLTSRFSSFGKVKTLDGLGKLDGLGQPRPFAYVTLETTKGQLAKCMNLLSGTTWKGAKLRIGEAKPDYSERIRKEHKMAGHDSARPKKRRRLARGCQGAHAADMSLVTTANFSARAGWRKTPLGRLVRPMRMRPLRPLPPPSASTSAVSGAQKLALAAARRKTKKRRDAVLVRARRKLIDPELWGNEYLKGVLLESTSGTTLPERPLKMRAALATHERKAVEPPSAPTVHTPAHTLPAPQDQERPSPPPSPSPAPISPASATQFESDLAREAARDLGLLASLFGSAGPRDEEDGDDDWGGAESLSDLDLPAEAERAVMSRSVAKGVEEEDDSIEYVPRDMPARKSRDERTAVQNAQTDDEDQIIEVDDAAPEMQQPSENAEPERKDAPQPNVQVTKLKDMFAPRAEDVRFSILGNLELDLELDDAFDLAAAPQPSQPQPHATHHMPAAASQHLPHSHPHPTPILDASKPLFFPLSFSTASHATGKRGSTRAPPDIIDALRSQGSAFHRTEGADAIRARWEVRKVELTRDWKRRHREAVKSARRRGGRQD